MGGEHYIAHRVISIIQGPIYSPLLPHYLEMQMQCRKTTGLHQHQSYQEVACHIYLSCMYNQGGGVQGKPGDRQVSQDVQKELL